LSPFDGYCGDCRGFENTQANIPFPFYQQLVHCKIIFLSFEKLFLK
jgi:hypothetical protein